MEALLLILGLIAGGLSAWFVQQYRFASKGISPAEADHLHSQIRNLELERAQKSEKIDNLESALSSMKKELDAAQTLTTTLNDRLAREETERAASERRIREQRQEFDKIKEQLKIDFQNLANSILEEKTKKFTDQNQANLDALLKPLSEKINEFKQKIESTHETQTRDGTALREQIKHLTALNVKMSEEANNLTNALKGQSKTMGNWGELILETLLENSGLRKGEEYLIRESFTNQDGRRSQPDVIINLPDQKHLVIDSKVSLVAYEQYCSTHASDGNGASHLKGHVASIRAHVRDLSKKNYHDLYQISAPDFVMMFVPLDPALITALQADRSLFVDSFSQGVFLVCPATLLFALRTIATLWQREKQNANAIEIARRGGALYDKFVGFYEQLQQLGNCIQKTQECYSESLNKLKTGKGNLIRQVEMIKQLGAKSGKSLPHDALEFDDVEPPLLEPTTPPQEDPF